MYGSHAGFGINEIADHINKNKHLILGKKIKKKRDQTKKKRNFIEDLPMDLHLKKNEIENASPIEDEGATEN